MTTDIFVAVVGSINADATYSVENLPQPGETVLSTSRHDAPGGKGANQAVALAALGVRSHMLGAVGNDEAGARIISHLESRGVHCDAIAATDVVSTGSAVIIVSASGENSIVVDSGANNSLQSKHVEKYFSENSPAVVMAQLEIPLSTVATAATLAPGIFILNPAPMPPASAKLSELIKACDILVPNRTELAALVGSSLPENVTEVISAAKRLDFEGKLVVTLGSEGALVFPEGISGASVKVDAPKVAAIDSSGAGDAFCAALAAGLLNGKDLVGATEYACEFASWTTTQIGAQVGEVGSDRRLVNS
jgi:ribokinase